MKKLIGTGIVLAATVAAATMLLGGPGLAAPGDNSVVGVWHATVHVDGGPVPFDTLYVFNRDGGSVRIDGRNNAPGVGAWTEDSHNRVAWTVVLFSFDASGHRLGTITSKQAAWVRNGVLQGTFQADGVDLAGNPLPGFPKTGTFTGERIEAQAPYRAS